jgi:hypothetical protein
MSPATAARWALYAGLAALQYAVATAYASRGTWWHWLLHQQVGWGLGLAVAALVMARTGRWVSPLWAALAGQLLSIAPDLAFRYLRMPHDPAMDVFAGHISIHRGVSPVVVTWAFLTLGAAAWLLASVRRRRGAAVLAAGALVLLTAACLTAEPLPERLSDYPSDSAPVRPGG